MIEIRNARIESVSLSCADHGVLTGWLTLDYGGSGQGFGGHALYCPENEKFPGPRRGYAAHFIWRCCEVVDVPTWESLKGKTIRAKCDQGKVYAIGHILKDKWFDVQKEFDELTKNDPMV